MKITISGTLGSGKSTVSKILSKKLNCEHYNTGHFMRTIAKEREMTLNELSLIAEKDDLIDKEIDDKQRNLGKEKDNFVFEGRLGYRFIPDSFKIFLKTSIEIAAKRIMKSMTLENDERKREGLIKDKDEIIKSLIRRRESEKKRYLKYYNVDYEDENNYDLVIDTTNINAEEVSNIIIKAINKNKINKKDN